MAMRSNKKRTSSAKKQNADATDSPADFIDEGPGQLADWLKSQREGKKWKVIEFAEKVGISVPAMYNLESGRTRNPQEKTIKKLEKALEIKIPKKVLDDSTQAELIEGIGALKDFDPYEDSSLPNAPGVYVFYDITDRPVYVGRSGRTISTRIQEHYEKFWFKRPVVDRAAYIQIDDETLRKQVEQVLIKFLKSNALLNKQYVERN